MYIAKQQSCQNLTRAPFLGYGVHDELKRKREPKSIFGFRSPNFFYRWWMKPAEMDHVRVTTIAVNQVACQAGPGILGFALHELQGFSPQFIPGDADDIPARVEAACPVCDSKPNGAGQVARAVRVVMSTSRPVSLAWYCFNHHGGFDGIRVALEKHRAATVTNLRIEEKRPIPKVDSDQLPELQDPLPDHQADQRCTDPRRIMHYSKELNRSTLRPVPCKRCLGCRHWRRAHRISRLKDNVAEWATVRRTPALAPAPFAALSRRLRRHGCDFVSVPVDAGRVILSNTVLDVGDVISVDDIATAIEDLVAMMVDAGRISGTAGTRKAKTRKDITWERIGVTKLDDVAVSRVHNQHGCPLIARDHRDVNGRGRPTGPQWDVSSLSPDQLLALWVALGVRITEGRKRKTRGAVSDVAMAA